MESPYTRSGRLNGVSDLWNVQQYEKFKRERSLPAHDLMTGINRKPSMVVVDLGCGTGELTRELHTSLDAYQTLGIDRSGTMLEKAEEFAAPGIVFRLGNIENFRADREYDLIFSNSALHWIPNHADVFERIVRALKPGGQVAVQMPKNASHPSQAVAIELAQEEPYAAFAPVGTDANTLPPDGYAALLDSLGLVDIDVRLKVYLHHLQSREEAIEWVKGTFLTDYQKSMSAPLYERFYAEYRRRFLERVEDANPYLLTYNRIMINARLPG
jgi:trans-aconitate 2-methyltransferase